MLEDWDCDIDFGGGGMDNQWADYQEFRMSPDRDSTYESIGSPRSLRRASSGCINPSVLQISDIPLQLAMDGEVIGGHSGLSLEDTDTSNVNVPSSPLIDNSRYVFEAPYDVASLVKQTFDQLTQRLQLLRFWKFLESARVVYDKKTPKDLTTVVERIRDNVLKDPETNLQARSPADVLEYLTLINEVCELLRAASRNELLPESLLLKPALHKPSPTKKKNWASYLYRFWLKAFRHIGGDEWESNIKTTTDGIRASRRDGEFLLVPESEYWTIWDNSDAELRFRITASPVESKRFQCLVPGSCSGPRRKARCEYPEFKELCKEVANMRTHIEKIHIRVPCDQCPHPRASFESKRVLQRHVASIHNPNPDVFPCEIDPACEYYSLGRVDNLTNHYLEKHKLEWEEIVKVRERRRRGPGASGQRGRVVKSKASPRKICGGSAFRRY